MSHPSVCLAASPAPRHLSHVSHQSHACYTPSMWSLCGPGLGAGPGSILVDSWGPKLEQAPGHLGTVSWGMGWNQRGCVPPQAELGPCGRWANSPQGGLRISGVALEAVGFAALDTKATRQGRPPWRAVPQLLTPARSQKPLSIPGLLPEPLPPPTLPPWAACLHMDIYTSDQSPPCRLSASQRISTDLDPEAPQFRSCLTLQGLMLQSDNRVAACLPLCLGSRHRQESPGQTHLPK